MTSKKFIKLYYYYYKKSGFFILGFGHLDGNYYIIMSKQIILYNPLDLFLKIHNINNVNKNIMIFSKNLKNYFRKLLDLSYEISGAIDYTDLLVNYNTTWKYLHNPTNIKQGHRDAVDLYVDKITFHTHPLSNYNNLKINIAWPSVEDYTAICYIIKNP